MLEPLPGGLRIVRTIAGTRTDVFDAWIEPERLRAWWGPPGVLVSDLQADLRVGGSYRIVMEARGEQRILVWTWREIAPPERLVYAWRWENGPEAGLESLVTVLFREAGERTEVELVHTGIPSDAIRDSHAAGWLACLENLAGT
jgi:uncharacterized protein YndB with AHSA1/START domain